MMCRIIILFWCLITSSLAGIIGKRGLIDIVRDTSSTLLGSRDGLNTPFGELVSAFNLGGDEEGRGLMLQSGGGLKNFRLPFSNQSIGDIGQIDRVGFDGDGNLLIGRQYLLGLLGAKGVDVKVPLGALTKPIRNP